jgi:NADPH:quinone reductase-like Zn-dependent oxidoreductase
MHALVARGGLRGPLLDDVAPASLGPTELRIQVAAAGINPIDIVVASGAAHERFGLPHQVGLGWDVSGTVIEIGPRVSGFALGDRVAGLHSDLAAPVRAQAVQTTLPASSATRVPDALELQAAAAIPVTALTARQALDLLGPSRGEGLLVTGAAGSLGGYAVTLARLAGWHVAALARPGDAYFVRRAGAEEYLTQLPSARFDAVLDAAALQGEAIAAVRDGGRFVGVVPAAPVPSERGITAAAVRIHADASALAELLVLAACAELEIRIAGTAPLSAAVDAYAAVAAAEHRGRWLLTP